MSKKVKQKENRRVTGRRTFLLGSGMLLATSFLSGRLYQLQVAQNNRYKRLSDRNQFDRRVVPPRAGVLSTGRNAFLPAMPNPIFFTSRRSMRAMWTSRWRSWPRLSN